MSRNPLVFGSSVILTAAILVFGFLLPRGREIDALRASIETEQADLGELSLRLAELETADPVALGELAMRYRGLVPGSVDLSAFLAMLDRLSAENGVVVSTVSLGAPLAASTGGVSAIGLNISVSGEYFPLAEFLFDLEHASRLVRASAISLSSGSSGGIQMSLSAEIYTTDPSAGPGSDPAVGPEVGA